MDKMAVNEMLYNWVYQTNNGGFGQWIYNEYRKASNHGEMKEFLQANGYNVLPIILAKAFKSRHTFGSNCNYERLTIWDENTGAYKE